MKYIVSYSGGLGSAITAKMVCDMYGPDNTILLFADTKIEDADLYRFNDDVKALLGCEFVTIADGRTPWEVFEDVKYIGNSRIDPCSKVLKRELIKSWLKTNFLYSDVNVFVGIDCTEEHRLAKVVEANKPYIYRSILIENNVFLTNDVKTQWCADNNIKMPRLYSMGFAHNNCGGFCVKTGQAQFALLHKYLPDVYAANEAEQERVMNNNPKLRPFIRRQEKGVVRYLTMKQFREEIIDKQAGHDDHDFGGCGCAIE